MFAIFSPKAFFIGAGSITLRETVRKLHDTCYLFTSQESSFCLPFYFCIGDDKEVAAFNSQQLEFNP